jgi:hypothetical protein
MERSYILAPFNSIHSLNDTIEADEFDLAPQNYFKFGLKVREINREYEQNNNADLDNGVINKALLELEN